MNDQEFGERLKQGCKKCPSAPTQQDRLRAWLGVSGPSVHYKVGARKPSIDRAIYMAEKLGVCVEWLYTGRGPKNPVDAEQRRL